jgi:hypothetical protein
MNFYRYLANTRLMWRLDLELVEIPRYERWYKYIKRGCALSGAIYGMWSMIDKHDDCPWDGHIYTNTVWCHGFIFGVIGYNIGVIAPLFAPAIISGLVLYIPAKIINETYRNQRTCKDND